MDSVSIQERTVRNLSGKWQCKYEYSVIIWKKLFKEVAIHAIIAHDVTSCGNDVISGKRKRFEENIMKKNKVRLVTAITAATMLLMACGSKEYVKDITPEKYVTLGNYMGIEAEETEPVVADGIVDSYINYILSRNATDTEVTGRAVQEGDTVSIDYVGYQDGEAFDGGTGSYDLVIGSGSFIDGFEDGLIGHEIGEEVTLNLTFPDPYDNNPDLAGKPVVFDVTINGISVSETPELTDDFVASLAIDGCNTVAEFKDYVYNLFYDDAVSTYENSIKKQITDGIMANCTFKEMPEEMVNRYYNTVIDSMTTQATSQGMSLDQYMSAYYGMDADTYPETLKENARTTAQQYVMLQAIANAEGIELTQDEIDAAVSDRVEAYGYDSVEDFKKSADMETFKEFLMADKVMDFLMENAAITTTPAETSTTTTEDTTEEETTEESSDEETEDAETSEDTEEATAEE